MAHGLEPKSEIVGIGVWVNNLGRENLQHATFDGDALVTFLRNDNDFARPGEVCRGLNPLNANNTRYGPSLVNAGRFPFIVNRTTEYRVIANYFFTENTRDWPFDTQQYEIVIELEGLSVKEAQFCFAEDYSGLSDQIRFAGRSPDDFSYTWSITNKTYQGFSNGTINYTTVSQFQMNIISTRPFLKSFIKFMLPPVFITICVIYTFLISDVVTRLGVLGSMLISAVLFHARVSDNAPVSDIMNRSDVFMVCVYENILIAFTLSMVLLVLNNSGKHRLASSISKYSELPGVLGSPVIFLALVFDIEYIWAVFLLQIVSVVIIFLATVVFRACISRWFSAAVQKLRGMLSVVIGHRETHTTHSDLELDVELDEHWVKEVS